MSNVNSNFYIHVIFFKNNIYLRNKRNNKYKLEMRFGLATGAILIINAAMSMSVFGFAFQRQNSLFVRHHNVKSVIRRYLSSSNSAVGDQILPEFVNKNNRDDQVFSALSACGGIKVTVATTRNIVNDLMIMHTMNPVPADALARAITCTLLVSNGMQDEQTLQVTIQGDGALRGIFAVSTGSGKVRGYVGNSQVNNIPLQEAVGRGSVQVVKMHPDWSTPYNGITAIRNGSIDIDIGCYLAESEQRSCALASATSMKGILCTSAGGYLVEQLPSCDKESIEKVERNLARVVKKDGGSAVPSNLLLEGVTPYEIASQLLEGMDMKPLGQISPEITCKCNEERLIRSVRLIPKEEVDQILKEHGQIEARCEFCSKIYRIDADRINNILNTATDDPSLYKDL